MTITQELLAESMTPQGYIDQIKVNKDPFVKIYEAVQIPSEVQGAFDALDPPRGYEIPRTLIRIHDERH